VYPGGKGPGNSESLVYIRGCKTANDTKALKLTSLLFMNELFSNSVQKITRVGTLIVTTIYLQLIQNRYMFRSFTVLQCSRQHCVQPFASDVEVVGYL